MSFKAFLTEALNQKINVSYKNKTACFDLDIQILLFYKNNTFDIFLKKYTEDNDNRLNLKIKRMNSQLDTISYYLFLNNYLVLYDDYIGEYYVEKIACMKEE